MNTRIDEAVDALWDNQIEWLRTLARFPSLRGNVEPCQNWLAKEFDMRGWEVDKFSISDVDIKGLPGASPVFEADYDQEIQVVATKKGTGVGGKSLIMQGHIDVVPTGPRELWAHDPFEPQIDGHKMTGRGVGDMKVGVAEIVFAMDAIQKAGIELGGDVFIQTVSEEECTGNGALATLARGYRADACLIAEAMGNKLIRSQLGSVWFRLRILGKPVHVNESTLGSSAIETMQFFIMAFKKLAAEMNEELNIPWYGEDKNVANFSVGKIRGGDWIGAVPAWCEIDARFGIAPTQKLDVVLQQIKDTANAVASELKFEHLPEVTWIGFHGEPYVLEPGSEAEAVLARAHQEVMGTELETIAIKATSDIRQYGLYYGIPSLCYGSASGGAHSQNEWADLESMRETTKIIARFVCDWCGAQT